MKNGKNAGNLFVKLATFIVDKYRIFFLIFGAAVIFCLFSSSWVSVNNDITSYLPPETETRRGLTLMEEEFITYGSAKVMLSNVTYEKAEELADSLRKIEGVQAVAFDQTGSHFQSAAALFDVTFDADTADEKSTLAMTRIKELLAPYDLSISSEVGKDMAASLGSEMQIVMLIAVVIIFSVLLFTSKTYLEIPVLLLTFGVAALLNMGTNYWFGQISFVTNSIAVVLQLALAIDYAIIFCHRFTEERLRLAKREAVIVALSKAIPEIASSSLTTISGLVALMFMQFRIGYDMGIVLAKAIVLSLISVFALMPGLLMLFGKGIDRTHHKSFVPNISLWGKAVVKSRYVVPPLFILLLVGAFVFQSQSHYVFGYSTINTVKQNETQLAEEKIKNTFGQPNTLAVLVPAGNYDAEKKLLGELSGLAHVSSAMGLANVEAMDGYVLTDRLTPRAFSELAGVDIEMARLLYGTYAVSEKNYSYLLSGLDDYGVPLLDMFLYLYDQKQAGYITLDGELSDTLDTLYLQLNAAKQQLQGENYSRLLLQLDLPEEGEETFSYLNTIRETVNKQYDTSYLVGNSVSNFDLSRSFSQDNTLISVLTAVFVMVILLFTFRSAGLPLLLVLTIQGSIWINFSIPYLTGSNLFFLSYLIVSAIQMGATIDYAIVITSRYMDLKKRLPIREAITEALNQAFPTVITSGTILASAGLLIGQMSSEPTICSIGTRLGIGTIISIVLVLGVLPQTLLLGDTLIEKTAFSLKKERERKEYSGSLRLDGHVKGYISGMVDADFKGTLKGTVEANLESNKTELDCIAGSAEMMEEEETKP